MGATEMIGQADADHFNQHGWWISPRILDEETLETLEHGIERFYAGDTDWQLPAVPPSDSGMNDSPDQTRQNDYVSLQVSEVRSFILEPRLGEVAMTVGRHAGLRLFHDQLISKPPGHSTVGWHTDRAYWLTCSAEDMLTIWVPLQDVNDVNGGLQVVDQSHTLDIDHNDMRGFHAGRNTASPKPWSPSSERTLQMKRGQFSIHHARTIHSSGPNNSDAPRRALAIHLQPLHNYYVPPPPGAPKLHFNDVLCGRIGDGTPDYSDPYVCPTVGHAGAGIR